MFPARSRNRGPRHNSPRPRPTTLTAELRYAYTARRPEGAWLFRISKKFSGSLAQHKNQPMNKSYIRNLLLLWMWLSAGAMAHEIRPAVVTVTFAAPRYQIDIATNLEAMLAGVSPKHADTSESPNAQRYDRLRALPPAELKARAQEFAPALVKGMAVEFDGKRVEPGLTNVDVPDVGDPKLARISTIHLEGAMPADAREFRWSFARELGDNVLKLREARREGVASVWLKNGEWSDPYVFGKGIQPRTAPQVAAQYVGLGFTHILPKGLD